MSAEFIKEFLCGIGFQVDQASMAKFTGGIAMATVAVKAVDAAIGLAVGAFKGMINSVPELAAEYRQLAKSAENAGVSIEELDRLQDMAPMLQSSAEAVRSSLENISRAAGDTVMGIGRAKAIFEKLNISVKDQNGKLKSSAVLMREVGEAVKGMERGQQKAVLERLGIDPTMLKGLTTDISGLTAEFNALQDGIDLEQAAKESKELGRNVEWIKFVVGKTREAFLSKFIGPVGKGIKWVAEMAKKYMPTIIQRMQPIIAVAIKIGTTVAGIASVWIKAGIAILSWLDDINQATGGWAVKIGLVILAWKTLNLSFLASPIGIVLALAAAIAVLFDDYNTWKEGGESLIDWNKWAPAMEGTINFIKAMELALEDLGAIIGRTVSLLVSLFSFDFRGAKEQFKDFAKDLPSELAFKNTGKAAAPAMLAPNPQAAAALGGNQQNINQKTQIIVQGAGDPQATAAAVGKQQSRVNADMVRNQKAVIQ